MWWCFSLHSQALRLFLATYHNRIGYSVIRVHISITSFRISKNAIGIVCESVASVFEWVNHLHHRVLTVGLNFERAVADVERAVADFERAEAAGIGNLFEIEWG